MAVPKQKLSRSKQRKRRTHWKLSPPALRACPNCGELTPPHRICRGCRVYRGRNYGKQKRAGA
ncbi:50S ribosomal protein L32 [Pasteuria penetrans]|uniref:50S ribosomal protein L32 n=1 Tax=Pasteuria penetrans TaxID=86005 RepID=UPI0011EFC1A9|nr:50S ribosomal protein L32 [Pasteuria penetrans]